MEKKELLSRIAGGFKNNRMVFNHTKRSFSTDKNPGQFLEICVNLGYHTFYCLEQLFMARNILEELRHEIAPQDTALRDFKRQDMNSCFIRAEENINEAMYHLSDLSYNFFDEGLKDDLKKFTSFFMDVKYFFNLWNENKEIPQIEAAYKNLRNLSRGTEVFEGNLSETEFFQAIMGYSMVMTAKYLRTHFDDEYAKNYVTSAVYDQAMFETVRNLEIPEPEEMFIHG